MAFKFQKKLNDWIRSKLPESKLLEDDSDNSEDGSDNKETFASYLAILLHHTSFHGSKVVIGPGFFEEIPGALVPLDDTIKVFTDLSKPYKGWYQIKRDVFQLFTGVANFIWGTMCTTVSIVIALPLFIIQTGMDFLLAAREAIKSKQTIGTFWENFNLRIASSVTHNLAFFVEHSLQTIKGLSQIITAPIKFPLRGIITLFSVGFGFQKIEHNPSIQSLVKQAQEIDADNSIAIDNRKRLIRNISSKYEAALEKGQPTKLIGLKELKYYEYYKEGQEKFLSFFKKPADSVPPPSAQGEAPDSNNTNLSSAKISTTLKPT